MADFLSNEFFQFIAPNINRLDALRTLLRCKDVPFSCVTLAGTEHVIVRFPSAAYSPLITDKILIAHYDRAEKSPGANDNSAAVYLLVSFAAFLLKQTAPHNIRIIFTGGEELCTGQSIAAQGSFALGAGMRKLGIDGGFVFVTDCCGRGDTLIVSETGLDYGASSTTFMHRQKDLYERATSFCAAAVHNTPFGWMSLPVSYGDNAGLTAAGVASQLITILPAAEATQFAAKLATVPGLRDAVVSKEARSRIPDFNVILPRTWQLINTPADTADTLTQDAFRLFSLFLNLLLELRVIKN